MVVQSPQENDMAADMAWLRAYEEAKDKRYMDGERDPASRAAGDITTRESIAAKGADIEYAPQAAAPKQKGKSAAEGATEGFMQGASTGNPYIMAATTAMGVINAEKDREAAAFQNKKTGQQNALSTYLKVIGGMA